MAKKRKQHSPTVRLSLPTATIYAGSPVTIGIAVNDVDGNLASGSLQWGDGSGTSWTVVAPTSLVHTYAAAGSYTIRATVQDTLGMIGSTTASITVQPPTPLPSVFQTDLIEAGPGSGTTGQQLGYSATAKFSDGTQQNVTPAATWASTNPAVATVVAGTVTTLAAGTTNIRSSYGGYTKDIPLTVSAPTPNPPAVPNSPSPADLATDISLTTTLHWASAGATTYAVAFGTVNPPPQVTTGLGTTAYQPGSLTNSTLYYWQITATNSGGSTAGPVWRFTTQAAALTPSPDPTFVPPSSQIVDNSLNVWTLGPVQPNGFSPILKNGVQVAGAFGAKIEWCGGQIYIQGDDTPASFWRYDAATNGWIYVGGSDPCVVSPPPTGLYVATTGSDTTGDGTVGNPYRTVPHALSQASAGTTILVRAGTYTDPITSAPSGSSWATPVRVAAYPGVAPYESVTFAPSGSAYVLWLQSGEHHVEFAGINLDGSGCQFGCVKIESNPNFDTHHIRLADGVLTCSLVPPATFSTIIYVIGVRTGAIGSNEFLRLTLQKAPGQTASAGSPTSTNVDGIYLQTPNNLVEGCLFVGLLGFAVQTYNGNTPSTLPSGNVIRYNIARDFISTVTKTQGFVIDMGDNNQVYGNLVFNLTSTVGGSRGFYLAGGNGTLAYNNTASRVASGGFRVDAGLVNLDVRNNLAFNNPGGNFENNGGYVFDHNSWDPVANGGLNNADPLFVNPAGGDFHLQTGSPAINAGVTIALVTRDLDDVSRPQGTGYDLGCYERA